MALSDLATADVAYLFATGDFGVSATYTLPSGETTSVTVVPFSEYTTNDDQQGIATRIRHMACAIKRSEVATINQKATVTIGDTEWSIATISGQDDDMAIVDLTRHELFEHTRPGYRRR